MSWFKNIDIKYLLIALIPCSIILGPLPHYPILYYAFLALLGIQAVSNPKEHCFGAIVFLAACAMSIIVGQPSPIFKSWDRLALFALLLFGVFPIFSNNKIYLLRSQVMKYSIWVCAFIGVTGVFCFYLGINYNSIIAYADAHTIEDAGWFAGLSRHAMMLGPCCAIGMVLFVWYALDKRKHKYIRLLDWSASLLCFLASLLSASRSAVLAGIVGVSVLLFYVFRGKISKFIGLIIVIGSLMIVGFPFYEKMAAPLIEKQEQNESQGGTLASRQEKWESRLGEFEEDPLFGIGFVAVNTDNRSDYDPYTGIVESGSSWLQLLSMTGLFGTVPFLALFIPTLFRLSKRQWSGNTHSYGTLLMAILAVFCVSMCAEGYLLAGGSFFCFMFWSVFGTAYSITHNPSLRF